MSRRLFCLIINLLMSASVYGSEILFVVVVVVYPTTLASLLERSDKPMIQTSVYVLICLGPLFRRRHGELGIHFWRQGEFFFIFKIATD